MVNKKRIGFFMKGFKDSVDYSNATVSNPGIGGTEFLVWTISYFLKKLVPDYEIYLFVKKATEFPKGIFPIVIEDEESCIRKSAELNLDFLIFRGPFISKSTSDLIEQSDVKVILWSHNFENYVCAKRIAKNPNIVRNICVSNEQRDLLLDSELYEKTRTIYNGICFKEYDEICEKHIPYRICYIGNLYPRSGYELVMNAWPHIEKKYPDAELYIIGGNDLYNVSAMKGAYSERGFKRLKDMEKKTFFEKGKRKPNIHFTGVIGGKEKLELMATATVGIANITLDGDTFGLAAVEFQALGVPIVSVNKYGLRETVKNNATGILVDDGVDIATAVCQILDNPLMREQMSLAGKSFVREHFDISKTVEKWKLLLENISDFENSNRGKEYYRYDGKQWIWYNAKLKKHAFLRKLPSVLLYRYLQYGARRLGQKFNLI